MVHKPCKETQSIYFIEANNSSKAIYLELMNQIYQDERIPTTWQDGEIIRIYKGKGMKGQCKNERGITLASNVGKLFERLINNRIKHTLRFTEAQAGGQEGKNVADHIIILNNAINQNKHKKNTQMHIAFLDVTKAFDKAWIKAILYVLNKNGIQGKNWRIIQQLNNNLKAKARTEHGLTRVISIKDSIRQGGVLSAIEYANLIDQIAQELKTTNIGNQQTYNTTMNNCLLWMDDVALFHNDPKELQKMLDVTDDIAKRFHIKFGKEKGSIHVKSSDFSESSHLTPSESFHFFYM